MFGMTKVKVQTIVGMFIHGMTMYNHTHNDNMCVNNKKFTSTQNICFLEGHLAHNSNANFI